MASGEGPLRTVRVDGLFGIVGSVSAPPLPTDTADVLAHHDLVERLAMACTVVPMRFGVVARDDQEVAAYLRREAAGLRALLDELDGREVFRVEATYLEDVAVREAVAAAPALLRHSRRSRTRPSAYHDRIALGQQVAAAISRLAEREGARLAAELSAHAHRATRLAPREGTVLRAAFLVERDDATSFRESAQGVADRERARLAVRLSGPMAAWDFTHGVPRERATRSRSGAWAS